MFLCFFLFVLDFSLNQSLSKQSLTLCKNQIMNGVMKNWSSFTQIFNSIGKNLLYSKALHGVKIHGFKIFYLACSLKQKKFVFQKRHYTCRLRNRSKYKNKFRSCSFAVSFRPRFLYKIRSLSKQSLTLCENQIMNGVMKNWSAFTQIFNSHRQKPSVL